MIDLWIPLWLGSIIKNEAGNVKVWMELKFWWTEHSNPDELICCEPFDLSELMEDSQTIVILWWWKTFNRHRER